ncbi:MAG: aminotransferase class III-fold pyridoxal phosphate-dependent enzyme [Actinobacteria bacterium]|nr:aminotransferase class III-fold pyridoxal phosphate-dependent enzyme [Actinomycetota bacterium]MCL6105462.1 aminotransferase class III-fold pyridoxal phosphate-dependent enzyme [Actinomycetota bacterium]
MKDWITRDEAVVWHGFTQMSCFGDNAPVIVDSAEGRELIDVQGNHYFDAISSLWVMTLGHKVPELDHAIAEQLGKVAHSTMLGNGNSKVVELAEALAPVVPVETPHFLFASDGACAVEQALKIAFQYWVNRGESRDEGGEVDGRTTRTTYLTLGSAYHGDTMGALSLGASGFGTELFDPLRFSVLRTPGYEDEEWLEKALKVLDENVNRLAAVVMEPLVQAASGVLVASPRDVEVFGKQVQARGVLLICDEVATGFGRTGAMFASEICGLEPDLMCLGKGITGGYLPMSATVASMQVYEAFLGEDLSDKTFYHGHSYGGNALCAAVALEHLKLLQRQNILEHVKVIASELSKILAGHIAPMKTVKAIRQQGLMVGIELNPSDDDPLLARKVCATAVRKGVLTRPLGLVLTLVLPLTTTVAELYKVVYVIKQAIVEVAGE